MVLNYILVGCPWLSLCTLGCRLREVQLYKRVRSCTLGRSLSLYNFVEPFPPRPPPARAPGDSLYRRVRSKHQQVIFWRGWIDKNKLLRFTDVGLFYKTNIFIHIKGLCKSTCHRLKNAKTCRRINWIAMVQFCHYWRLYLGIEIACCRLLQRMARMDVDGNLKK